MNNIAILLSTYNGEAYILDQLRSLGNQSCLNFDLYIRDDASNDNTVTLIKQFQSRSNLSITLLPTDKNLGARDSFQCLLKHSVQSQKYEYFMFCDQDDVWVKDKVLESYEKMQCFDNPLESLLIYTDLQVVDENLNILGDSLWHDFNLDPNKKSLNYLVMQCNITGCTMIFNRKLAELSLPFTSDAIMHDYWIALVASAMGHIDYLNKPTIAYRQHGSNVSGGADKFNFTYITQKALKFFNVDEFYQVLGRQIIQSKSFLLQYHDQLSNENIEILEAITTLQSVSLLKRVILIMKYKLYKHGAIRNIGLFLWIIKMPSGLKK